MMIWIFSDTIVGSDILEQTLIYNNHIYQKNIHTVLLHPVRSELEEPIIDMNKSDSLLLSFDDLDGNFKNFYFTLIHCNADWTPSNLLESEYLEGSPKHLFTTTNPLLTPYKVIPIIMPLFRLKT